MHWIEIYKWFHPITIIIGLVLGCCIAWYIYRNEDQ
jgi:hypothetical protein